MELPGSGAAGAQIDFISIHKYHRYEDYETLVACPLQAQHTFEQLASLIGSTSPESCGGLLTQAGRRPTFIAVDELNAWHEEAQAAPSSTRS